MVLILKIVQWYLSGFGALYFKMLCRIYAWKVRLRLCIYVFPGVGGHAGEHKGGGLQHGVAPFWVHFHPDIRREESLIVI